MSIHVPGESTAVHLLSRFSNTFPSLSLSVLKVEQGQPLLPTVAKRRQ